jgi:DnaJ-class molecular chaperone
MKNAWFDHKPHQLVACTECHTNAPMSQKTEDVLLPVMATCQKCHYDGSKAAESSCYECHAYHDWTKAKPTVNANAISQFGR